MSSTGVRLALSLLGRLHVRRRLRKMAARASCVLGQARAMWDPSLRPLRLEVCPICGNRGRFEFENKVSVLCRCERCDHVYARDLPSDAALQSLYGDFGYWLKDRVHQGISTIQAGQAWEGFLQARIGILERMRCLAPHPGRATLVFEIGCSEGILLHELGKRGLQASGCEMNVAVAEQGIRQLGANILTAPFETLALPARHFDLVMAFHTLEHMRFPVEVLAKAAGMLRADGVLLIEVPGGKEEYDNTDHLHFFSEQSLRLLLERFFRATEIVKNEYTNSAGTRIVSLYGVGRGVRDADVASTPDTGATQP
jgi:2-polyprenyl-3-methyl-5-hydroxy-6-metoxy-1,4-benzoquinol methylase